MNIADPLSSLRDRRWASPLGWTLLAVALGLIIAAPLTVSVPVLPPLLSVTAGFAIGIGYQFQPFLHRRGTRAPNRTLCGWLFGVSVALFIGALAVAVLGWTPVGAGLGLVLLAGALALLLIGLTEVYPAGDNIPGLFLVPVGLDGLMLQALAPSWSNAAQAAVAIALFVPSTGAAVVLTVWAFRIRRASVVIYAKATETARGVLWAWGLLVGGVMVWNWFGIAFTDSDWANPVVWALPIVTVGSVLATATTGWTSYLEARGELAEREYMRL